MRRQLRTIVIGVACGTCLLVALAAAGWWAQDAYWRSWETPAERHAALLAPRLTPQARADDEAAAGLTAEAVVVALEDAGFWCCPPGSEGCSGAGAPWSGLEGALRDYACRLYGEEGSTWRGISVFSYRDGEEARRAATRVNLDNRSGATAQCALSRGPVVVAVSSLDLEFVSKLRAILDGVQ